jgi:DNA-binding beta-propeller fold protein YncE
MSPKELPRAAGRRPLGARHRSWVLRAATAGLLALLAACNSSPSRPLPPAAEPAESPPVDRQPAGRVVPVGPGPEGIVADPATGLVAVGLRSPDEIALLDRDGRVVRRIGLASPPRHLALAGPGGPLLVPAEGSDELVLISLPEGRVEATVKVGSTPHDAAALDGRIFVGNEFGDSVSVIEQAQVVETVEAPLQPGGVAAVDGEVAVVGVRDRRMQTMDAERLRPLANVDAGTGPTHVVAGPEGRLYVADTDGNALLVFSTSPELVQIARIEEPGEPYGLAMDLRHQRLWVTLTATNTLVEYDVSGVEPRRLRTFPTPRQPNTVAVEASRGLVFVTGTATGEVQIVDVGRPG